jgi:UDPglucose--hexose-1-phosphate uridylyltransferase
VSETTLPTRDAAALGLNVRRRQLPDGRYLLLYDEHDAGPDLPEPPWRGAAREGSAGTPPSSHLRLDAASDEWVIVAPHRQDRTFHPPEEYCPLCPTGEGEEPTEVPVSGFDLAVFENRFPGLVRQHAGGDPAPAMEDPSSPLTATAPGRGQAEVVVYTSEHAGSLGGLPPDKVDRLLRVWTHRYAELSARPYIRNVFIFENRGPEIGVTLGHPHGQIYGHPFVPPIPARMLEAEAGHHERTGCCLRCDMLAEELAEEARLVLTSDAVVAHVPFAPRWPYEVHVALRPHRSSLLDVEAGERRELATVLKSVLQTYDRLFARPMPYILAAIQAPTADTAGPGSHLRFEIYPALRGPEKLKYRAGSETAMGVTVTDVLPESAAAELREALG